MLTNLLGARPDPTGFESFTWELVERGERHNLGHGRLLWRRAIQQATSSLSVLPSEFDLLLTPVTAQLPPLIGHLDPRLGLDTLVPRSLPHAVFTAPANTSGLPATSMPLHASASGLPIGVQAIGRWGDEATLLRLAAQLEQTHPWAVRRPQVV